MPHRILLALLAAFGLSLTSAWGQPPSLFLPLGRTAYFIGEQVLVTVTAPAGEASITLAAGEREWPIYRGKPGPVVLDTRALAPGAYTLSVNGVDTGQPLFLVSTLRRSAASLQDEAFPGAEPQYTAAENKDPVLKATRLASYRAGVAQRMRETGMVAAMGMMSAGQRQLSILDTAAREGLLYFNNPETRPTSFLPVAVNPLELAGLTERMLFTAQANSRYPNFGGFCLGFDTTGYQPGGRRMLLQYWNWGKSADAVRQYIDENDRLLTGEFTRRTGYAWVTPEEYIAYTLSIGRPDMAPAIDLPTQRWLDQITPAMKPFSPAERLAFEKRLDAWSAYLMGRYGETYTYFTRHLRAFDPTLRHTSSVQIDHAPVNQGQYLPPAYQPLDFRYQSTWNDQVGAPDYAYQWLFTAGMLNTERPEGQPVWISNAHGYAHGRSAFPGKFTRVAAHILPHGGSGIGNAFEAFSTLLGGMGETSKDPALLTDVHAGRDFMDRFVGLALEGRGDHGVGILFSKTQFGRQYITQAFGTPQFRAFISLTRLGYTPVYLTEDEIAARQFRGVKSLVVVSQTVPLPAAVQEGLRAFVAAGGLLVRDGSTNVELPAATALPLTLPLRNTPGRPHNWACPISAPAFLFDEQHRELAPPLEAALAGRGHALLRAERGAQTELTVMQVHGGTDARYLLAINDSFVKTQADWHIITETLLPRDAGVTGVLYDLTAEQALGPVAPIACDLSETTARVYGLLTRELKTADIRCRQSLTAGQPLTISVAFIAADGKPLAAMLPFHLTVRQPDGTPFFAGYRFTARDGQFATELCVPENLPAGQWTVQVRSQLTGVTTTVPVTVKTAKSRLPAIALRDPLVVRERAVIAETFAPGTTVVLPLFPKQSALAGVAEILRAKLQAKGVIVTILPTPAITDYFLAYAPTEEQGAANMTVEDGQAIGRIKRLTTHGNDWFGGYSYRSARPVLLLDLATVADNEMAETLTTQGLLWPQPTPGLSVVQGVSWAFGPRGPAVVLSAVDVAGLQAAAERITTLPDDFLTASVRDARTSLFRELRIGGAPDAPAVKGLTGKGATTEHQPVPFRIQFGAARPYPSDQQPIPAPVTPHIVSLPSVPRPTELTAKVRMADGYVSAFVYRSESDLRFSDALALEVDVPAAGPVDIGYDGVFRYLDRAPCSAPQWEDVLAIRRKYYTPTRLPITVDVLVDGKPAGVLAQTVVGERDVQLELYAPAGGKPKSQLEEVVTSVNGTIPLPAGRHTLLFVPRNIVDGRLTRLRLATSAADADAQEAKIKAEQEAEKKRKDDEKRNAGKK
jgi:hypothetical protein